MIRKSVWRERTVYECARAKFGVFCASLHMQRHWRLARNKSQHAIVAHFTMARTLTDRLSVVTAAHEAHFQTAPQYGHKSHNANNPLTERRTAARLLPRRSRSPEERMPTFLEAPALPLHHRACSRCRTPLRATRTRAVLALSAARVGARDHCRTVQRLHWRTSGM